MIYIIKHWYIGIINFRIRHEQKKQSVMATVVSRKHEKTLDEKRYEYQRTK